MYDSTLTHQALPDERYRMLIGTAVCVFNSNNSFIIENILRTCDLYSWYKLIDKESGNLKDAIADTITKNAGPDIADKFHEIISHRNRIIHSYQITSKDNTQILAVSGGLK